MKNISGREKIIYLIFIALLIALLLLSTITDIYARYSSTITGSGNIELAKWSFKVNDAGEGEDFVIDIKTSDEAKVAPGSTGTFNLKLENFSDVAAQYTIELSEKFINTQIDTDAIKIYTDSEYKTMIDLKNNVLTGKLQSGETKVITLYWKWVANEEKDQIIAENYDGFTISAKVIGEQTIIVEGENVEMTIK